MRRIYRLSVFLTATCTRIVEVEGLAATLLEKYPVKLYPHPFTRRAGEKKGREPEDILFGRGGSILYCLEQADVELFQKEPPKWELATHDPRF